MKVSSIVLIFVLIGLVQARITDLDVVEAEFRSFKEKHQKVYENVEEELKRMQIFMENKKVIDKHNKRYAAGEVTYKMGVNQFTDLLPSEFRSQMLLKLNASEMTGNIDGIYSPDDVEAPRGVDWRYKGAVTPVKDQGYYCGCCWAFASVAALESHHFIKTGQLISLSEQNLVDCSTSFGNNGCHGGNRISAYQYVQYNGGLDTESSYPYEAQNGKCRFKRNGIGARVSKVVKVPNSEAALAHAVAYKGPVTVGVDATNFQNYRGDIFTGPCSGDINHAVTVIGYTDNAWIIKNSWGPRWGKQGYMLLGAGNCQIARNAVYPEV